MTQNSLPEEKLLRLIRQKKSDKKPVATTKASAPMSEATQQRILTCLNVIGVFASIVFTGMLTYRFWNPLSSDRSVLMPSESLVETEPEISSSLVREGKPLAYYQEQLAQRDLFERPLAQVAANVRVDLTKRYKLVGIILGDVPEAIVEDLTSRRTLFVHEGDMIDAVQVKTIAEGRVVFLQEGLEIELKQ